MRKQFMAVLLLFASCKTLSPDAADLLVEHCSKRCG